MPDSDFVAVGRGYDSSYSEPNFFGYRAWLYRPFIRSLAACAGLRHGSTVLDLGCGQGFFTHLFHELGCVAHGVDASIEGIRSAARTYGHRPGLTFDVGDAMALPYGAEFDCAFARSCTLYNREDFPDATATTDRFLEYVRPGGVLVFDYYTTLAPDRPGTSSWRYHSLSELACHFARYPQVETFFSLRAETLVLGAHAFGRGVTRAGAWISRRFGIGGELVALVRKP